MSQPQTPVGGLDLRHIPSAILQGSVGGERDTVPLQQERQSTATSPNVWRAPSIPQALEYVDAHHPRDEEGKPLSVCKSTTGRYCTENGCGKLFDPFNEGRNSDLDSFGPGITNYFKFLKWSVYMFFFWVLYSIPALIVNSWGTGIDTSLDPFSRLAVTTIGNLGEACGDAACDLNITSVVLFPGCEDGNDEPFLYGFNSCEIDKKELAFVYSFLDVAAIGTTFIMYLWLRIFERRTPILLRSECRTAADFTVQCVNVPHNTEAARLSKHMEDVTGCKVADVQIAEDCGDLFHLFRKRGKLIDEKRRLDRLILKLRHEENQWNNTHERDWPHRCTPFSFYLDHTQSQSIRL
jgi:hypothetical protein